MQNTPAARPRQPLLWLGSLVLVLHLWLLAQPLPRPSITPPGAPDATPDRVASTGVMRTRTIAAPPVLPVATPDVSVIAPKPRPRPQRASAEGQAQATAAARNTTPTAPPTATPVDTTTSSPTPAAEGPTAPAAPETSPADNAAPEPASASEPSAPTAAPTQGNARVVLPAPSRLKYDVAGTVRGLNYSAYGELLWRPGSSDQDYEARLEIGIFLLGSRVQTSRGRISEQGLVPRRFSDKARSEVAAHLERDKGKVIFSANAPSVDLQPDAQDQLSVFIQLAGLLAGEPERYPPGSSLNLQAVGARDAPVWQFAVDGPEQLQLPGGTLATLKLTRPPTHGYDVKAELWLAPQLGYLPARIRLTQSNGDFVDQQWTGSEAP